MAHELALNFPFGDSGCIDDADTLRLNVRNRIRCAALISDHDVDTSEVGALIADIEAMTRAADKLDDGESVTLASNTASPTDEMLAAHANTLRCAIDGLLETNLGREHVDALSELGYGLEIALRARADRAESRNRIRYDGEQ